MGRFEKIGYIRGDGIGCRCDVGRASARWIGALAVAGLVVALLVRDCGAPGPAPRPAVPEAPKPETRSAPPRSAHRAARVEPEVPRAAPGSATPDASGPAGDPEDAGGAPPAPPGTVKARLAKAKVRVRDVEYSALDLLGRLSAEADVDVFVTPAAYDSWTGPGVIWPFGRGTTSVTGASLLESFERFVKVDVRTDCIVISWKEHDTPDPATLVRAGRRPTDPAAPAPRFTIVVTDPGGSPVAGASLWETETVPRLAARADAAGAASFPVLVASGPLFATAPGFQRSSEFRYPRGLAGGDRLEVRLGPAAASLRGVVRTPDGAPVAEASLRAVPAGWKPETGPPSVWERTDADGRWALESLVPGPAHIEIHGKGWAIGWVPVELTTGAPRETEVRLRRPATVSGVVRSKDGTPLAEAGIYARLPGMDYDCAWVYSGADGKFLLEGLPPGSVRLRAATLQGDRRADNEVTLTEAGTVEWEAVLPD